MEEIIKRLIIINLNGNVKKEITKIKKECKKEQIDFEKENKKAKVAAEKLQSKASKLGFNATKESFNNLIEYYLMNKKNFKDKEKREYLKLLVLLSELYDTDLKRELEEKQDEKQKQEKQRNLENKCKKSCIRYYLEGKKEEEEYKKVKELAEKKNIDVKKIENNSKKYIEKITSFAKKLGVQPTYEETEKFINKYKKDKKHLNEAEKLDYLRLSTILTEIYDMDLRSELREEKKKKEVLLNPLQENEFLKNIIKERYTSSSFSIEEMYEEEKEYNFAKEQIVLLKEIQKILVDNEGSNPQVKEGFEKLKEITKIDKKNKLICKCLKTIEYTSPHIGIGEKSIFILPTTCSQIAIYLNIPNTKEKYLLLNQYILKCLKNHLNYDMWNQFKITLFASKEDYPKKIAILKEIEKEHPEYFKELKKFKHTAQVKNSFYSISCIKINNESIDNYNEYFNTLVELSYYRTIAKIVLNKMVVPEEIKIIKNFIGLNNVEIEPDKIMFNTIAFKEIKDIINKNIPDIKKTLEIYMDKKIDTLLEEFKKSMQYIANKLTNNNKKAKINIACNRCKRNE